ncbi:sodium-independent sulfate anion transporter-like [Daphnia carinata]|uniref:sodium-independent sulfate anion transporter-like n=1 Tax=Daphnia carinata TaxID=120202 RepID=UPI002869464D|nr:sodium-independent sulfate anion transporter-like [Daphnia carinata]
MEIGNLVRAHMTEFLLMNSTIFAADDGDVEKEEEQEAKALLAVWIRISANAADEQEEKEEEDVKQEENEEDDQTLAEILDEIKAQRETLALAKARVWSVRLLSGMFRLSPFGSTPVVTIGPTALMSLVTYDSVAALMGPEAAILLAFLTGCIVLLFGLLNFGFLIDFFAAEAVAGFTSAAAFAMAATQIEALFGLRFDDEGFLNTCTAVFEHIEETKKWDAVLGFASIAILLLLRI